MSSADPAAKLEELLTDDFFAPDIDETLSVVDDYLQTRGNARGELISLEQALAGAHPG